MQRHRASQPGLPGAIPSASHRLLSKAPDQCFRTHLQTILAGTGISKRPFTLPKRLPVSEPPFRGQSSRPTSSTPYRSFARPVRIPIPPRTPGLPRCARDRYRNPVASLASGTPNRSSNLHSPSGPFGPLRIKAFNPTPG